MADRGNKVRLCCDKIEAEKTMIHINVNCLEK